MAREKSSGKTSFGKRTQAEKNFRDRKKTERDDSRPRFDGESRKRSFSDRSDSPRKSYGSSSFRKRDEDSSDRPKRSYTKRDSSDFERPQRSYRKRDDGDNEGPQRSYRKRDEDSFGRPQRSSFRARKDEGSSERPQRSYRKRDEGESSERSFSKPSFRKSDDRFSKFSKDEPREKRKSFSRDRDDERPARKFSRDDVRKVDDKFFNDKNEKPVYSKSERGDYKKPYRSKGPKQEHQRKNIDDGVKKDDGLIRLNKFMANSGVGSRREADEFIKMGLVTVNGETITEMGHKVKPTDDIRYEGRKLKAEPLVYVLLNKPKGFITTTDDPEERNTVMDLVASACKERIYPVGRLDRNTTGLLLLTNDGDLADKLTHPSYNVKKIYKVELDRALNKNDFQKIVEGGLYLDEGKVQVDDLAMVSDDGREVGIELHIGWNRIVRRIFETLGYEIAKLDRVVYAGLDKKDLSRGQWRFLKPEEIVRLKHFNKS